MLLSPLFSAGEVTSEYCVQSWASLTEVVLGVNLWSSLPEDAEGAHHSHGLKKRKTDLLGTHSWKKSLHGKPLIILIPPLIGEGPEFQIAGAW